MLGASQKGLAGERIRPNGNVCCTVDFPREIRHALGTTTIESKPERIVVLDTGELDAMVQLGIRPVGAAEYNAAGLPQYLRDQVQGIEVVGTTAEPDLEAILALNPDLILSSKLRHEAIYDRLSAIAPTVQAGQFLEVDSATWIGGVGYGAVFEIFDQLAAYFGIASGA